MARANNQNSEKKETTKEEVVRFEVPEDQAPPVATSSISEASDKEHEKAFPRKLSFLLKNKNLFPLTINLCAGKRSRFWKRENGMKVVNNEVPEPCKSCPGREVHLLKSEAQEINVVMEHCLISDQMRDIETSKPRQLVIYKLKQDKGHLVKTPILLDQLSKKGE